MIRSFRCKETEKLFRGHFSTKLPQDIQRTAAMKLHMLHAATLLATLRVPPSNHLEALAGDRQWRICYSWQGSDAHDVAIVDYH